MTHYEKYMSTSGLSTKGWGPSGWFFLFSCIMGAYPPQIDNRKIEHRLIKKNFKDMIYSLRYTMPCIFCRESFKGFVKESPIDPHLTGRIELMRWLYNIRDRVNQKLMKQEMECYKDEKKRLKVLLRKNKITKEQYNRELRKFKTDTLITHQSPPFEKVLDKYEALRAVCSKKSKTCSLPKK